MSGGTFGREVQLPRAANRNDSSIGTWWRVGDTVVVRCPHCGAGQHVAMASVKASPYPAIAALGFVESITCVGCRRYLYVMLRDFFAAPDAATEAGR